MNRLTYAEVPVCMDLYYWNRVLESTLWTLDGLAITRWTDLFMHCMRRQEGRREEGSSSSRKYGGKIRRGPCWHTKILSSPIWHSIRSQTRKRVFLFCRGSTTSLPSFCTIRMAKGRHISLNKSLYLTEIAWAYQCLQRWITNLHTKPERSGIKRLRYFDLLLFRACKSCHFSYFPRLFPSPPVPRFFAMVSWFFPFAWDCLASSLLSSVYTQRNLVESFWTFQLY